MNKKHMLIDGHSILVRAFYGVPMLTTSNGVHTNAVYGFLNMMFKFLEEENPDYLTVAFDMPVPTFRHETYSDYKGTRGSMEIELKEQIPIIQSVLNAMNIAVVMQPGLEADDLLGTIARRSEEVGMNVTIISGDRDLLQLATEKTQIRIPKTKKGGNEVENYYAADVKEKYLVSPIEFIDVKALMGDTSDNIPGVPGIGEKTATKLIAEYGSIESVYNKAVCGELKPPKACKAMLEHYELAKLSKELATIKTDAKMEEFLFENGVYSLDKAKKAEMFNEETRKWFDALELHKWDNKF